jgi:hypothetical protein
LIRQEKATAVSSFIASNPRLQRTPLRAPLSRKPFGATSIVRE